MKILEEARDVSIETIYFEGGESFLYYPALIRGVNEALSSGVVFESLTWLPERPLISKPNLLHSIFTTVSPDTFLSSGNRRHLEGGYERLPLIFQREFLQIKFGGLPEIVYSLLQGFFPD